MDRFEQRDSAAGGFGAEEAASLTLDEWRLAGRPEGASVTLPGDADLEDDYADLVQAAQLTIELPVFMDGRAFSHARKLRDLGFEGALLASGDVLADQWQFLQRCGFSALVDSTGAQAAAELTRFSDAYQGDVLDSRPVFRRHARG